FHRGCSKRDRNILRPPQRRCGPGAVDSPDVEDRAYSTRTASPCARHGPRLARNSQTLGGQGGAMIDGMPVNRWIAAPALLGSVMLAGGCAHMRLGPTPDREQVTILYVADVHGQLEPHPALFWGEGGERVETA